jgi:septal ring factor EnvC (AmiA/AmiB activator)
MSGASAEAVTSGSRLPTKSPVTTENVTHEIPPPQTSFQDVGVRDDITELKSSLDSVRGELSKLQVHRRKYKARFNANVHTIAEKLTDLDDRVTDLKSMSHLLDDVIHVDIPDLQSQVEALQEQMDTVTRVRDFPAPVAEALSEREDVKESVDALNGLVIAMMTLHKHTQSQMEVELEAVRAARIEAVAAITAEAKTPSLKRKRGLDESGDGGAKMCADEDGKAGGTQCPPHIAIPVANAIAAPPAKRARRIVSAVAQTATAVTIGAVVTWSALAFS